MRCCMRRAGLSSRRSHEPRMFPDFDRERERILLVRSQRVSAGALLPLSPTRDTPQPLAAATRATPRGDGTRVEYQLAAPPHSAVMFKAATLQTRLLQHLDEDRERAVAARRLARGTEVLFSAPPPIDFPVHPVSAPLEAPAPPASRLSRQGGAST
ncbi:hypothetical protein O3G_MSEX008706 [Manduca sexta]|uniref:Uncharacterized protein n=2 Tax=Manduca sexta TaxID=7130 RepID=A0A921ZAC8_MANSE|nr:hypothetical protein O3G_MSEX008706 [Manduca sexta]